MSDLSSYRALCAGKRPAALRGGLERVPALNPTLFPHAAHGVDFALRAGRAALFYDTGLAKTSMELEWGRVIVEHTNKPVLMLCPLAVAKQHQREAERLGIETTLSRFGAIPEKPMIAITNYERLGYFDPADYAGIILDESSRLKNFSGKQSRALIAAFASTQYRLAASATPAPNDYTELGTHSDFLGVMRRDEMLLRWFLHDSANTKDWRIKGHAVRPFWDWVASWARCVSRPSDIGFSDNGFVLPPLDIRRHIVAADRSINAGEEKDGQARLFRIPDRSATSIHKEKRLTNSDRASMVAKIVDETSPTEPICIWVDTDYEAKEVRAAVPAAVEVHGSMTPDQKEELLDSFSRGETRIMLTKSSIAGLGLNWQHCNTTIFAGLSFSYEAFYQAIRRFYRFGQKRPVTAHIVCADTEVEIADAVNKKAVGHERMKSEMSAAMARACRKHTVLDPYNPDMEASLPAWMR